MPWSTRASADIAASEAGVHTTLEVWPRMVHVRHWYARMLDEGQQAIDRVALRPV